MPKNIEMSVLGSDGTYDVLYPKNISDIVLSSEYLKGVFNLSDNSDIDDAFDYINRKIILLQYNKAGINVTLKSAGGSPLEGIKIKGITASYDGIGECRTDGQGKCFGYCDAGQVTVSCDTFTDLSVNSQQINTIATQMYNVSLTGTVTNFIKWTSTTNAIFSNNVQSVDVTCVGGGGGAGYGFCNGEETRSYSAGAGGGGYCVVQEFVNFIPENSYAVVVGAGGTGALTYSNSNTAPGNGTNGGISSFLNINANGGNGGGGSFYDTNYGTVTIGVGGAGNGNGANGKAGAGNGYNGTAGGVAGYSSFIEEVYYGGSGGSGGVADSSWSSPVYTGGTGGGYGGNGGQGENRRYPRRYDGNSGQNGFGGGGGSGGISIGEQEEGGWRNTYQIGYGGNGGSGCVAIRIHLKVTA